MIKSAYYARVSSDRQEREDTVQSQLGELRAKVAEDGLNGSLEFVDESYSRDNLVRPGLDRLRDLVAQGELDRVSCDWWSSTLRCKMTGFGSRPSSRLTAMRVNCVHVTLSLAKGRAEPRKVHGSPEVVLLANIIVYP